MERKTKLFGTDIISLEERVILRAPVAICALFESFLPDHISKITGNQHVITPNLKVCFNDFSKALNSFFGNFEAITEIDELKVNETIKVLENVIKRPASTEIQTKPLMDLKKAIFIHYLIKLDKPVQKQIVLRIFREFKDMKLVKEIVNRYFH